MPSSTEIELTRVPGRSGSETPIRTLRDPRITILRPETWPKHQGVRVGPRQRPDAPSRSPLLEEQNGKRRNVRANNHQRSEKDHHGNPPYKRALAQRRIDCSNPGCRAQDKYSDAPSQSLREANEPFGATQYVANLPGRVSARVRRSERRGRSATNPLRIVSFVSGAERRIGPARPHSRSGLE